MIYLAAVLIVAGVALFVAAPLGGGLTARRRAGLKEAEAERLEHERALAMQGLRELEFDREMGKLAEGDYAALREALMTRALNASGALEGLRAAAPAASPALAVSAASAASQAAAAARPRLVKSAPSPAARIRFCPQCGAEAMPGNFCSECGAPLAGLTRAAARAER